MRRQRRFNSPVLLSEYSNGSVNSKSDQPSRAPPPPPSWAFVVGHLSVPGVGICEKTSAGDGAFVNSSRSG